MTTLNVTEARANLYKLIDDKSVSHEPVFITGKRGNAVFSRGLLISGCLCLKGEVDTEAAKPCSFHHKVCYS